MSDFNETRHVNCSNLDGVGLSTDTDSLSDKQGAVKLNLSTNNVSPLSLSKTKDFASIPEAIKDIHNGKVFTLSL